MRSIFEKTFVTLVLFFSVSAQAAEESPITKKQTVGFAATTTLKRSEFGMTKYVPGLSDEVKIYIEAEANRD